VQEVEVEVEVGILDVQYARIYIYIYVSRRRDQIMCIRDEDLLFCFCFCICIYSLCFKYSHGQVIRDAMLMRETGIRNLIRCSSGLTVALCSCGGSGRVGDEGGDLAEAQS